MKPTITFGSLIFLSLFVPLPARCDERADQEAVEAARQALAGVTRFPWYDRSRDSVRRLNALPRDPADSTNRGSSWIDASRSGATTGRMPRTGALGTALQWIGLTTLVMLLGLIAFFIAKALLSEEVSESTPARKIVASTHDVDRVEALPFKVPGSPDDLLGQARRLYEAGQYSQAVVYLYSYQLVQLDKHHLIRLAKGKTNRQYLREIRHRGDLYGLLQTTMIAFEDAYFGGMTLSKERCDRCWRRLEDFHGLLEKESRAAA